MNSNAKTYSRQSSFRNLFLRKPNTTRTVSMAIREPNTTRTVSMAAGQMIPLYKKPENNSLECGSSQETSNRWIKRLRPHPSDSLPTSSKRLKTSENEYKVQARNLLGIILNVDSCNHYLSKFLEERQELKSTHGECAYEESKAMNDGECAYEDSKAMNNWIQRWCRGSRQAAPIRKVAPVLCEPERSRMMLQASDGKRLPSIAAMALMGAAVKNLKTCRYKKKGSLLVWYI